MSNDEAKNSNCEYAVWQNGKLMDCGAIGSRYRVTGLTGDLFKATSWSVGGERYGESAALTVDSVLCASHADKLIGPGFNLSLADASQQLSPMTCAG